MISISAGADCINTSYISKATDINDKQVVKKKYVNKNTIDSKLNLIIT
jgi:hypothetical protein